MAFLNDRCARVPLTPKIVAACTPFSCGNKDLDEFFSTDYLDYAKQLMGKTYAFLEIDNPREIICAFTVSNASIFTNHPGSPDRSTRRQQQVLAPAHRQGADAKHQKLVC